MRSTIVLRDVFSTVNSMLRILATLYIFIFHCNGLFEISNWGLVRYAFCIFMYLSGYYSLLAHGKRLSWLIRRLRRIFIPYWIVMLAVVFANNYFHYKKVGIFEEIILMVGANFFIDNKLYVISWFVSVVVLFYIHLYVVSSQKGTLKKTFAFLVSVLIFYLVNVPMYFLFFFYLGLLSHAFLAGLGISHKTIEVDSRVQSVFVVASKLSCLVQRNSYEFFLLHGGVLLFFKKILAASYPTTFALGLIFSVFLASALRITVSRINVAIDKYLQ